MLMLMLVHIRGAYARVQVLQPRQRPAAFRAACIHHRVRLWAISILLHSGTSRISSASPRQEAQHAGIIAGPHQFWHRLNAQSGRPLRIRLPLRCFRCFPAAITSMAQVDRLGSRRAQR